MKIEFEVEGRPVAKARPRIGKFGTYTPQKTKNYEELVKYSFIKKYSKFEPFKGELKARLEFVFEVPKSYSKKKREVLLTGASYTKKPDFDNLAKATTDALNGLAYIDDCQISCALILKRYGHKARTIIEIEEVG